MGDLKRFYPSLSFDHVRVLASIVLRERNFVAETTKAFANERWGMACLSCERVKNKLAAISKAGTYPWLNYVQELGMAYTVLIGDVPLRIQPDVDEVRDLMPGEERARTLRGQTSFGTPEFGAPSTLLRLEVAQEPGKPVETITLYLFDERTLVELDSVVVFDRADRTPSVVASLVREPEDADIHNVFRFPSRNDNAESDDTE